MIRINIRADCPGVKPFLCLLLFAAECAFCGTIGFSIGFNGQDLSITNTGTDAAYQLSAWTLDRTDHWQAVLIRQGNPAYLPPGHSVDGRRSAPAPDKGLGQADPLLVLLYDKAGSLISQLAWRQTPPSLAAPLKVDRKGSSLRVLADTAAPGELTSTCAIAVPYQGVQSLTQPFAPMPRPPDPVCHSWNTVSALSIDTGAGQSGAWLIHASSAGRLNLQVVPEGLIRGQAHKPAWLIWTRENLMLIARWWVVAALMAVFAGLILAWLGDKTANPS